MAKRKKAKISLFSAVFMCVGLAGAVFAIVGLFVSWFATDLKLDIIYAGLFDDVNEVFGEISDFPYVTIQIFAIASAVLAALSAVVCLLKGFNVVKVGFLAKLLLAALTAACGVVVIILAGAFIADFNVLNNISLAFGVFFTAVGAIASGAALLLQ